MAFNRGPKIVTQGLVLALDAASKNSYPGSGTTWTDLSGNNNTGTLVNSPTFSSDNNGILIFNGINHNVSVPNSNTYLTGSYFTFSTWVNIPTTAAANTYYSILNKNNYNTNGISIIIGTGGLASNQIQLSNIRMSVSGNIAVATQFTLSPIVPFNTWNQFTYTLNYDNTNTYLSLYINGLFRQTLTIGSGSFIGNTNSLSIGAPGPGNGTYFSGSMANYQIHNRALSSDEVLQNYNATKSRFNL
jgi:hypothetical protein